MQRDWLESERLRLRGKPCLRNRHSLKVGGSGRDVLLGVGLLPPAMRMCSLKHQWSPLSP